LSACASIHAGFYRVADTSGKDHQPLQLNHRSQSLPGVGDLMNRGIIAARGRLVKGIGLPRQSRFNCHLGNRLCSLLRE
jgi:hypothetical protein